MYGTIARFRLKAGAEAKLEEVIKGYDSASIPGMIDEWVYRSDEDPRTHYMAVLFESKEAYVKNAESPEQDKRYQLFRALLEGDPEWHDGEVTHVHSQMRAAKRRRAAA
jgi:heme-degrading monooxygenase HmoA